MSWTATRSYQDVSVYVPLGQGAATYANPVYAYLTTRIGGGTTKADEIATSVTYFTPAADPTVQVFSGLTLTPGTYYLTLWSPVLAGGGWEFATEPNVLTDSGVTLGASQTAYRYIGLDRKFGQDFWNPPSDLYIPASGFFPLYSNESLVFDVEAGVDHSATPEPASFDLLGLAALAGISIYGAQMLLGRHSAIARTTAISARDGIL